VESGLLDGMRDIATLMLFLKQRRNSMCLVAIFVRFLDVFILHTAALRPWHKYRHLQYSSDLPWAPNLPCRCSAIPRVRGATQCTYSTIVPPRPPASFHVGRGLGSKPFALEKVNQKTGDLPREEKAGPFLPPVLAATPGEV
jgi:hypothetical protein